MKADYEVGKEISYVSENKDWRKGGLISCGVDLGSVSTKIVICIDGELYAYNILRTGSNSRDCAERAFSQIEKLTGLKIKDCAYIVGTGYGRVNVPYANRTVTEISCHALGAHYIGGESIRTVLDMGGQDCKAIRIDSSGKVVNFLMNDKCAAGTGRGMEVLAELLEVPLEEIGIRSFDIDSEPDPVSNVCVVYARTEAIGLLRKGWPKNKVIAAYCRAMAERVASLLKRIGVEPDFLVTGGISKNIGIVKRIERIIGISAKKTAIDTQIAGALGAALFAKKFYERERG